MDLSLVSRTAILTLICRTIEAEKDGSEFHDPMAVLCLERLLCMASAEERRWIAREKRIFSGREAHSTRALAKRAKAFDSITDRFMAAHPACTVVNLGCGFDTRFWRIDASRCRYIELDLPEVISLKKEILKDHINYELIDVSALDTSWIDQVTVKGNTDFLLLAEGLIMFFPKQEAARLLREIGGKFRRSQLALDMVPEKYTRGIWKFFLRLETRITWGLDVSWAYGIQDPHELEDYGNGLKVIGVEKGSAGPIITLSVNVR